MNGSEEKKQKVTIRKRVVSTATGAQIRRMFQNISLLI